MTVKKTWIRRPVFTTSVYLFPSSKFGAIPGRAGSQHAQSRAEHPHREQTKDEHLAVLSLDHYTTLKLRALIHLMC